MDEKTKDYFLHLILGKNKKFKMLLSDNIEYILDNEALFVNDYNKKICFQISIKNSDIILSDQSILDEPLKKYLDILYKQVIKNADEFDLKINPEQKRRLPKRKTGQI